MALLVIAATESKAVAQTTFAEVSAIPLAASGVSLSPGGLFISESSSEVLIVGIGLVEREVTWFLWKVGADGAVRGHARLSPALLGKGTLVVGCVLEARGSAICLVMRTGGVPAVLRSGFDEKVTWLEARKGADLTWVSLARIRELVGDRFVGVGNQAGKPYALAFRGDGRILWAQSFAASGEGELDDALELPDGNLLLNGRVYDSAATKAHTKGWACLVDPSGKLLAQHAFEEARGPLVVLRMETASASEAPESEASAVAAPGVVLSWTPIPWKFPPLGPRWARVEETGIVTLTTESLAVRVDLWDMEGKLLATWMSGTGDLMPFSGLLAARDRGHVYFLAQELLTEANKRIEQGLRLIRFKVN